MFNVSAGLMLQTIMMMVEKQNASTETTRLPSNFMPDADSERCYGIYGCFSIAQPWVTETRPVGLFPIPAEEMNVRYTIEKVFYMSFGLYVSLRDANLQYPVFTRRNPNTPLILEATDTSKIRNANIDRDGPFYIISHGYVESGDKPWIQNMTDALLWHEGNSAATVFVLDWRGGSSPPYTQAVANVRLVGAITAQLIYNLYVHLGLSNLDNFHFIGHSLGAHCGGYTGYTLQKKFSLTLGRITGMDPAEPHFAKTDNMVRLDRTDAKFVDIIHTDATPFVSGGFGISESIGHVDFFPNGGSNQPGCNEGVLKYIRSEDGSVFRGIRRFVSCNHVRSYEYFTESIAPACPFMAIRCATYQEFLKGNCFKCGYDGHHCLPMGMRSQHFYNRLLVSGTVAPSTSLDMYMMTGDTKPFCRVHYKVTYNISESAESETHGGEVGRLWLVFVNQEDKKSEKIPLDEEGGKYHKPGTQRTIVVAARNAGSPPKSAILEWEYETNLLNPLTWRILSSPRIYVSWMQIDSLEFSNSINVCPLKDTPVVANMASHFQQQHCQTL